jgi:hypothetical protein
MKKIGYALLSIVVIALAFGYLAANRSQGSDNDQIIALIEQGRHAVETKSVDSAMSCISKNYDGEAGLNRDKLRLLIADAFRNSEAKFEVSVDTPVIEMQGKDKARADANVIISASNSGAKQDIFSGRIGLFLTRERTRKYFIFPTREWRVTGIGGLDKLSDLM